MIKAPSIILASASSRRADLLRDAGIAFSVHPADINEDVLANESPEDYVLRMAKTKAKAIALQLDGESSTSNVLAADTIVVIDHIILGKPKDRQEASAMISNLSGRTHEVHTAFSIITPDAELHHIEKTLVYFRSLDDAHIQRYLDLGGWDDKAGAYGIQSQAGHLVSRIEGSHSNVIGLPIAEVIEAFEKLGIL